MTRDEERRVDDLPEERGTMSAREALWDAFKAALPEYEDSVCSEPTNYVDEVMHALRRAGFGIYQLQPEPKVT
jgi:hypothetical protein